MSVIDDVRRDIVAGHLPPGSRLTEASLAERYGVSRVPVREALRGLEGEGFVESRPHVGATVAQIPLDEADDLFAVREALEMATASRAAKRAKAMFSASAPLADWWEMRRELELILDEGDAAVARDDLDPLVELNDRFHVGVAILSGSPTLASLLRQLSRKIEWLYALDTFSRGKRLWPDHRRILAAIDSGDAARAAELMGAHVRGSRIGWARRSGDADLIAELERVPPAAAAVLSESL